MFQELLMCFDTLLVFFNTGICFFLNFVELLQECVKDEFFLVYFQKRSSENEQLTVCVFAVRYLWREGSGVQPHTSCVACCLP